MTLVGIEGYFLRDDKIEPSSLNSIYFSGTDIRREALPGDTAYEKARSFLLARQGDDLYFDFDLAPGVSD